MKEPAVVLVVLPSGPAYCLDNTAATLTTFGLLGGDVVFPLLKLEDKTLVDLSLSLVDRLMNVPLAQ